MRLGLFSSKGRRPAAAVTDEALQERFGTHFSQLFAYSRSLVVDDLKAGSIVVEAFCEAFWRCPDASDSDFRLELFALARGLCRGAVFKERRGDPLSSREREVLSLLFDAQLSRGDISLLMRMKEEKVTADLLRGLKKLRGAAPAALAAQLHAT